jgi:hypothetical protein
MLWILPVSAATVVYTDKTEWENALSEQFLTEDFTDLQLNTGVSFVATAPSGHINPVTTTPFGSVGGYYTDVMADSNPNNPSTTWSFTPEITAYGGDWTLGGPGGSGNSLNVYIGDSTFVGSISSSYMGAFWGFISDSPFASVKLQGAAWSNQQNYQLDNMVYSPASVVADAAAVSAPVPAAVWLFGSGLIGLIGINRRKRA